MSCAEMTSKVGVAHKISRALTRAVCLAPPLSQSWIRPCAASFEEKDGILYHSSTDFEAEIKRLRRVVVGKQDLSMLVMMVLMVGIMAEIKH